MSEQELPKILIVEDGFFEQQDYKRALQGVAQILPARSIEEAQQLFLANRDIKLIVMDACVPDDSPTTQPLVKEFRAVFSGPIIAASSMKEYRNELMAAGCSHESPKRDIPKLVKDLLANMVTVEQPAANTTTEHPGPASAKAAQSKGAGFGEHIP